METVVIRAHNGHLPEHVDQAHVPLRRSAVGGAPTAYLGTRKGPGEVTGLHTGVMVQSHVWDWVGSLGYERVPAEVPA